MSSLQIDYYSDLGCPWCIVGQRRLDKVLGQSFPDLSVDIKHHPAIILLDCPAEGAPVGDLLRSRYGITEPRTAFAAPEAAARESGLALNLSHQRFAYPTLPAHTLIRLAETKDTAHALCLAIISAYFLDARNTSDPSVLADIAINYGFSFEEAKSAVESPGELEKTQREVDAVAAMGIRSVPQFVIRGGATVKGVSSEGELISAIKDAINVSSEAGCVEGACSL